MVDSVDSVDLVDLVDLVLRRDLEFRSGRCVLFMRRHRVRLGKFRSSTSALVA